MTYHFREGQGARQERTLTYSGPDYSQDYHTYSVEWFPGEIRWYIDSVERFRTVALGISNPLYVILNTTVGGDWPGNPDSTTVLPQYFDIDYVRIYRSQ